MNVDLTIKNYRCFSDDSPARLSLRSGITSLVGINNSGKSTILKFFYEFRLLFASLSGPTGDFAKALSKNQRSFSLASSISDIAEMFYNLNSRNIEIHFEFPNTSSSENSLQKIVVVIPRGSSGYTVSVYLNNGEYQFSQTPSFSGDGTIIFDRKPIVSLSPFFDTCKILQNTTYLGPFRNAINIGSNSSYFDIEVGEAFIRKWRVWKTGKTRSQNEASIKLTEEIEKIFGFESLEINPSDDNQTLQLFINGRSYRLDELGAGLAQFIIVLANVATRKPSLILIDEPELSLHPSLQLDFITTLASYATEGVLFASHSIGLARAAADRIYSVQKSKNSGSRIIEFEATNNLVEFLGELSFSGYRELGFDKILLVEGVSEVKTLQQLLRLYHKDHEIVLLPLGGSQMINGDRASELNELKRISNNVHALIDSEKASEQSDISQERKDFSALCKKLSINCHILTKRAIENYLPDRAVKKIKGDKYTALSPFQKLKDVELSWSKMENWRIAREMSIEEIKGTDLGTFLESI